MSGRFIWRAGFIFVRSVVGAVMRPPFAAVVMTLVHRATQIPAFSIPSLLWANTYPLWICRIVPLLPSPPDSRTTSPIRISEPFLSVATAFLRASIF